MPRRKTITKRPTHREPVRWVAFNDNARDDEGVAAVEGYISTLLVADLFGADPCSVAVDVVRTRHGAGPFATQAEKEANEQRALAALAQR